MRLFGIEKGLRTNGHEEYGPRRGRIRGLYNKLRFGRYTPVMFDVAEYERQQAGRRGIKPLSNPGYREVEGLQCMLALAENPKLRVAWYTDEDGVKDDLEIEEAELEKVKGEIKTDLDIAINEAIRFQEFMEVMAW